MTFVVNIYPLLQYYLHAIYENSENTGFNFYQQFVNNLGLYLVNNTEH